MSTCELAVTVLARMRGLLHRDPDETTLVLAPCRHIHTFGMAHPIDVAFVAGDGLILSVHRGIGPSRHLRERCAVAVIERFAQDGAWFQRGDYLKLSSTGVRVRSRVVRTALKRIPSRGAVGDAL